MRCPENETVILLDALCMVKEIIRIGTVVKRVKRGNFKKPRVLGLPHASGELARNHATGSVDDLVGHYDYGSWS